MTASSNDTDWVRVCCAIDYTAGQPVLVRAVRKRGRLICKSIPFDKSEIAQSVAAGAAIAVSLSPKESLTTWIEAPFSSLSKARKVFPTLLDIKLPFALEDCVYDFIENPLSVKQTPLRALAVAARTADVTKRLSQLAETGVDPHILDHEGLTLWTQSLREHPGSSVDAGLPRVILSLGKNTHTLVIGTGNSFLSAHSVKADDPASMERLLRARLGAIQREDRSSMPAKDDSRRVQWMWCGAGAMDAGIINPLKQRLESVWPGPSTVHDDPSTFLARALATRVLLKEPFRCNLRKDELAHEGTLALLFRRSLKRAFVLFLSGLLLCGINAAWSLVAKYRINEANRDFGSRVDNLLGYHLAGARGAQAVTVVHRKNSEQAELMQPFLDAFNPSLLCPLAETLSVAAKHDLRLEYFAIDLNNVDITGKGSDAEGAAALCKTLESAGYTLKLDETESEEDGKTTFSISTGGES